MAREYGKNWFSMWTDEDFCTGRLFDKLFYQVLLGQSGTNDAGICPINYRKWRKALRDGTEMPTERDVKASLLRQERRRYVFTDEDTGEVLIRSHIRRDQVHRQPALMVSALRDLKVCQSPKFAVIMLSELSRIEMPTVSTTTKQGERLRDSLKIEYDLALTHLKTLAEGWQEPLPEPFTEDFPEGLPEPFPRPGEMGGSTEGSRSGFHRPPVVVEVEVASSPSVGGWVGEVEPTQREIAAKPASPALNEPPADRCPKHVNHPDPPNCGACAGYRRNRERWDANAEQRRADARAAFWAEIRRCRGCDERGYRLGADGQSAVPAARCPNHDWSQNHA